MFHSFCVDWLIEEMESQNSPYFKDLTESLSTPEMDQPTSLNGVEIESESYSNLNGQKRLILSFLNQHELKSQQSWTCHIEEGLTSAISLVTFDLSSFIRLSYLLAITSINMWCILSVLPRGSLKKKRVLFHLIACYFCCPLTPASILRGTWQTEPSLLLSFKQSPLGTTPFAMVIKKRVDPSLDGDASEHIDQVPVVGHWLSSSWTIRVHPIGLKPFFCKVHLSVKRKREEEGEECNVVRTIVGNEGHKVSIGMEEKKQLCLSIHWKFTMCKKKGRNWTNEKQKNG